MSEDQELTEAQKLIVDEMIKHVKWLSKKIAEAKSKGRTTVTFTSIDAEITVMKFIAACLAKNITMPPEALEEMLEAAAEASPNMIEMFCQAANQAIEMVKKHEREQSPRKDEQ